MFKKSSTIISCWRRAYSSNFGNVKARKYVLTKYFQGEPKMDDFKIVEEHLPDLKDGGNIFFL